MKNSKITLLIKFVFLFSGVLFSGSALGQTKPKVDLEYNFSVGSYSGTLNYFRKDIVIPGMDLAPEISFIYSGARNKSDIGYGNGWIFSYSFNYDFDSLKNVFIYKNDGSKHIFTKTKEGYISPGSARYDVLEEYETNKFRLKLKANGLYYYFDNKIHRRLTAIENFLGQRTELLYADSLPVLITDPAKRKILLKWSGGHLINVVEENTSIARVFRYSYDSKGNLTEVTDPLKNILKYAYDLQNHLVFFQDKKGNPLKIEYKYDEVVKKVSTCMHDVSFTYDVTNRKTFVLEKVGEEKVITTYHFDEQGRNIERKGNCCGFNVKQKYDNNDNVIEKTDGNNFTIKYAYDAHGNVTKQTDGSANEVKFDFDPKTNKLKSKTDELGNTTFYKYDPKNNLVEIDYPLNIKEKYEYNEYGLMTRYIDKNGLAINYSYDQFRYLSSVIFPDGSVITYVNDALGNLLKETDANNNSTRYEYDLLNRPVKKINALGGQSLIEYDANGNIIKETNELEYSIKKEYDPLDRLIHTVTAEGIEHFTEYDNRGNIVAEIDGRGNKTTFTHNDMGQVTSQTDALGNRVNYQFDAAGRKVEESDKMGNTMTYLYNNTGQLTRKTDPAGNTMSFMYDVKGRLISETDGNGNTKYYQFDALNRKIKEIDPLGFSIVYSYDNMNNLIKEIDKDGSVTNYGYDKRYRRIFIQSPLGIKATFQYDAAGNMVSKSPAPGVTEVFTFDKLNREIEHVFQNGEKETKTYDASGRLTVQKFSNGNVVTNEYDKDNRPVKSYDKVGVFEEKTYDKNNNIIKRIDADGKTTVYQYDALNRLVSTQAPAGTESVEYNANGMPVKHTNSALESKLVSYNSLGFVTKVVDINNTVTSYTYDGMGNTLTIVDPNGNTSSFTYNKLNKLTSTVYADGTKVEYELDAAGNVVKKKTGSSTIEYKYDSLGRQISKILPGNSTSTFVYDNRSRMVEAKNQHATIKFSYDVRDRLLKEVVNEKDEISYAYDVENNTRTITYPGGRKIVEEQDYTNRPEKITQNGSLVATVTYNGMKPATTTFGNGVNTVFSYTAAGRIQNISVNSGSLFNYTYGYDNKNNVIQKEASHHPEFSEVYAYNNANQLVFYKKGEIVKQDIPSPSDQVDYVYDLLGNYVSKTKDGVSENYKSNTVNQYLSLTKGNTTTALSYSPAGNLIKMGDISYEYDAENRLTKVGSSITYNYDALGRRFEKISGGATTTYFYYQDQLAVERNSSGTSTEYIYSAGNGMLLASIKGGSIHYYHTNELGSIVGLTNGNGAVVEQYEYDPYGNVTIYDADFHKIQTSSIGNHILFTGREYDVESGLYYMRSRHYSPTLGRFIQKDPISYDGGTYNLYEYVSSNPVNFIDPFGLNKCTSTSGGWSADISRFTTGSITTPVSLKSSINFTVESKTCEVCCDGKKSSSNETKFEASGSMTLSINLLNFAGPSRALVAALSRAGLELFGGGRLSAKVAGGYTKSEECGKVSGGGSVSFTLEVSAELSLTRPEGSPGEGGELNVNSGMSIQLSGIARYAKTSEGTISFSTEGADKKCNSKFEQEVSFTYSLSYTWNGIQIRHSEQYRTASSTSGSTCPPGL